MHPTPVSLRTKNATFGGDITRFLKGVGPEIHIGGEGGREEGREGGRGKCSEHSIILALSVKITFPVSLHKPELLLDLDEIYAIPEGSSLRNFFFGGGGEGKWMKDMCLCS